MAFVSSCRPSHIGRWEGCSDAIRSRPPPPPPRHLPRNHGGGKQLLKIRREHFVGGELTRGEALLVDVTAERVPSGTVRLDAVRPEVVAEDGSGFFDMVEQEWE